MRRSFWLPIGLVATLELAPLNARADIPVIDEANIIQLIKGYEQQLRSWILQQQQEFHEAATDLNTFKTYLQEVRTYLALVQNPNLATAMPLLNQLGLGSDLPVDPRQIMSLANGFTSMGQGGTLNGELARLTMIAGYSGNAYTVNHIYTCNAGDPTCADINARGNGIAGSMGVMQAGYADIERRQGVIAGLRADLTGITDPAKRETIIAQIDAEQLYIDQTNAALSAAAQQQQLAQQSAQQRIVERQRQAADQWFAQTQPLAPGGLQDGPPPPPVFTVAEGQ